MDMKEKTEHGRVMARVSDHYLESLHRFSEGQMI